MDNGSSIIFGSSSHSVPKDNTVNGRISIATFMTPKSKIDEEIINQLQNLNII
jgi:hypothetical protein